MIVRILKSNSPAAFFILPLIAIIIWSFGFGALHLSEVRHSMPFYELLVRPVAGIPWLCNIIAILLVTGEGFLLNYIVNENEALTRKTALPALLYFAFLSIHIDMLQLHPILFANLFLLFALSKILNSYRKDTAFSQVFDAGLLISVATLFYLPCIVLFPLLGIALILFRPFMWREWIISFFGVLVPFIFVISWYFWKDTLDYLLYDKMFFPIVFKEQGTRLNQFFYILASTGLIIVLLSFGKLFNDLGGGSQKTKKALILMLWMTAFASLSIFLVPAITPISFALFAIPLSVICSNYFIRIRKELWGELLFLLFIALLLINLAVNIF
ncbi:MAG TPA: DUF6427 family protein [Bacteroidia bacterium]|jgi:hypothetical protein